MQRLVFALFGLMILWASWQNVQVKALSQKLEGIGERVQVVREERAVLEERLAERQLELLEMQRQAL